MTKLYFVRHGLTTNNVKNAFNGSHSNPELLPEGREQARRLGQHLAQIPFTKAYVSPQIRAVETAQLVLGENQQAQPRLDQHELLREIDFGEWDGVPIALKEQDEQYINLKQYPHLYDPSSFGGESFTELVQRGQAFIQSLDFTTNESILVVGHGVTLMTILQTLDNKEIHQLRDKGLLSNASLSVVETADGKQFKQTLWNFTVE